MNKEKLTELYKEYKLEKHKAKLKYRLLGINIGIYKTYYKSIFGPTLKKKMYLNISII